MNKIKISLSLTIAVIAVAGAMAFLNSYRNTQQSPTKIVTKVTASLSGTVQTIFVSEKQAVEKGSKLFALNAEPFQQAIANSRQQVQNAFAERAQLIEEINNARNIITTQKKVVDTLQTQWQQLSTKHLSNITSASLTALQQEITNAQNSLNTAEKNANELEDQLGETVADFGPVKLALLQLRLAEHNLNELTITAPNAGVVNNISITPGSTIIAGTPCLLLVDTK